MLIRKYCLNSLTFCIKEYGVLLDKPVPKITLTETLKNFGMYHFRKNIIFLNPKYHISKNKNVIDLVEISNTIIHEYQHYLQDEAEYFKQISSTKTSAEVDKIKYEYTARRIANRDNLKCHTYSINYL